MSLSLSSRLFPVVNGLRRTLLHSAPTSINKNNTQSLSLSARVFNDEDPSASCSRSQAKPKAKSKKKKTKTPKGRLDDFDSAPPSNAEKEPLAPHPGGVNPETGEQNGPKGPEPTRYGDWERKGRVSDF